MKVIKSIQDMRRWRKANITRSIGLVPTMGYLHEGHLSLIRAAKRTAERVVVSIYVNPKQFAADEDLDRYPRNFKHDEQLCDTENVDVVFYPPDDTMYLPDHKTYVVTEDLAHTLCGRSRQTHFQGVTTIVAKLFNIVQPSIAVFGQKDAQQALIIRRMVQDLNFDIQIEVAPIVREADGLALSSRNKYLDKKQRLEAGVLQHSLQIAQDELIRGNTNFKQIRKQMIELIQKRSSAKLDYVEFTNAETLTEVQPDTKKILVALAAYFGQTRLIDNIIIDQL